MTAAPIPTTADVISVRGARVHNLRNVDCDLPRGQFVVITGVSGSGKSSLAFDTLFAEGQRRYLESLSSYTRQFLGQLERPDVDDVLGLPPTLSVEQRSGAVQPRSTLATLTEIHDFLRLLFARAGTPHCPQCGRAVSQQPVPAIVDGILALEAGRKVMILAPLVRGRKGTHRELFEKICRDRFVRARVDGELVDAAQPPELKKSKPHDIDVVIDRIHVKDGLRSRLQESVELAVKQGDGNCIISHEADGQWNDHLYSTRFACPDCNLSLPTIEPRTFSFNSPYGACARCEGLGSLTGDDASAATVCPDCQGARLGPAARAVTFRGLAIHGFCALTVEQAETAVNAWQKELNRATGVPSAEARVVEQLFPEISRRLKFLNRVGLGYLSLDRTTSTLSGGEFQRARLAGCLGSGLVGVCYVLDEPTIGLHPRDTGRLLGALRDLRDQGNSVLVVEHDLDVMRSADRLFDLGPGAGSEGGLIVAEGTPDEVMADPQSVTGRFLRGEVDAVSATGKSAQQRRLFQDEHCLSLTGASLHNLQNISLQIPLGVLVCVTGVSGSGKSSLVMETLVPELRRALAGRTFADRNAGGRKRPAAVHNAGPLAGSEHLDRLVEIDQSPIGRTGRSNPATASGVWDDIRKVFARTREARLRGFTARRFSFNTAGGRCDECQGQGTRRIAMHFLPDLNIVCSACRGARFNRQTLQIRFRGKNIADVLNMRIDEAAQFFENFAALRAKLQMFADVGLGYLTLGQSSLTLSGGEAQRVKLASELGRPGAGRTLFVLDEPTTGLHPADVDRLLALLQRLVQEGQSVLITEHHLGVIAASDWVIDLGPEGGAAGGRVVAVGRPEEIARVAASHTGQALAAAYFRS